MYRRAMGAATAVLATVMAASLAMAVETTPFQVNNANGKCKTIVSDEGKVGINNCDPQYTLDIANQDGGANSSIHLSFNGQDSGGYITSAAENNFWLSSGAAYDATRGWVQKSSDHCSSMHGSGSAGYRVYMQCGYNPGDAIPQPYRVMLIDYNGAANFSGSVQINTVQATRPACDATKAGTFWYTQGASGVKDTLDVCSKDAANAYAWRGVTLN